MDHQPVRSSNLRSVGYDPDSQTLEIAFRKGGVYEYFDVPQHVYEGLMAATSKGKYHWKHIRGRYRYQRVFRGYS